MSLKNLGMHLTQPTAIRRVSEMILATAPQFGLRGVNVID